MKLRLLPLILVFFISFSAVAQKTFVEFIGESDRIFFDGVFANSTFAKDHKAEIKQKAITKANLAPKRIGLISMYVFEENFQRRKAHLTYIYSKEGELNYFINNISSNALQGLTAAFEGSGYELVLPEEFLKGANAKAALDATLEEVSTFSDPFIQAIQSYDLTPSAEGQLFVHNWVEEGTNGYIADLMAQLAKDLGLDALLTVKISSLYQTNTISFSSVDFLMHGINPAGDELEQGIILSNYMLYPDYPYPFVSVRNGKTSSERFGAFRKLLERSGKDFLKFTTDEIDDAF
ncbi:MAG: hypothetical protein R8G66_07970 [Cytophagales bacterium]|nr:hypothetical protein [Cytophagales bacterium]